MAGRRTGRIAPHEPTSQYSHNDTGEDNADVHSKRPIIGHEVVIALTEGRLDFGTWEQIFSREFDGRRRKRVPVKKIGDRMRPDPSRHLYIADPERNLSGAGGRSDPLAPPAQDLHSQIIPGRIT